MNSYLGIDVGGTKTLIVVFDGDGNITGQEKIATSQDYKDFLNKVEEVVAKISTNTNVACGLATPGIVNRDDGTVHSFGANINWKDKNVVKDISKITGDIPVLIENDAKAAGLAEAGALAGRYESVLYLTVSTGIGGAFLNNGQLVKEVRDSEMGHIQLQYEGKTQTWESFASGKAIVERYGKRASDITDEKSWQEIGERIGYGLAVCCDIMQPEAVVFGGGAGQYADKFKGYTSAYLDKYLLPTIRRPVLLAPKYADNSAIHGCFLLLRQHGLVK